MKPYIYTLLLLILALPIVTFAQFRPLVGIPGVSAGSFDSYINALYALSISIAALLAVIKIIIAGVKWMMTDVVTSKGEAKKDIQGALVGLLIVLAAVLIISVINPDIGVVDLSMSSVPPVAPTPAPSLAMAPYTPNVAQGYTWIPNDSPAGQRNQFRSDCTTSGGRAQLEGSTNQYRCYALSASEQTFANNLFASVSDPVKRAALIEQYTWSINTIAVYDPTVISQIATDQGASGMYFVVQSSIPPTQGETQVQGMCDEIATANGYDGQDLVVVSVVGGSRYIGCAIP